MNRFSLEANQFPMESVIAEPWTIETRRGGVDLVDQLAPQWRDLCSRASSDEPFYRPEWIGAYLRAFQPEGHFLSLTAQRAGRLTALLPLVEEHGFLCGLPVRKLRGTANVHSCRFDLVRHTGAEGESAVKAIWQSIRDRLEWDVIELPDVPEGGGAEMLLDAARNDGYPTGQWPTMESPFVPLEGVTDPALIPNNSHFRQNLRRRLRKARERWDLRLRRIDTSEPGGLGSFYQVESGGWKGQRGSAIACENATMRFYNEIARVAALNGYFSLYLLEFGDQVVAGHFGLVYAGRYYTPKVAYDERFHTYGPGHLLVDAVLRDCLQQGLTEFDFLGPRMAWKDEWARDARRHSNCYIFQNSSYGRTLRQAKFRIQTALRTVARNPVMASLRDQGNARERRMRHGAPDLLK
jgi:CelD/BcsL family acetyltransferase involved in cellulose biosynthesis